MIAIGRQVHGAELQVHAGPQVPSPFAEPGSPIAEVDGHVIAEPDLAALVFVADCLPVALAGPGGVAMLHCGWRGLAAGIVARGAEAVAATDAAIGPGIGACCYEVGEEVLGAFAELGARDRRRSHARSAGGGAAPARARRRRADRERRPLHELRAGPLLLAPPRRRHDRPPGRHRLARGGRLRWSSRSAASTRETIAANLERVRARAGEGVEILAATKYVPIEEMGALAEAGVTLVGENRQQDLAAKRERWGDAFEWDFIGNLQSRKVKQLLPPAG